MFKIILARLQQGHRTMKYPDGPLPELPDPKVVIAVGACAISGGPYIDHPQANNGADAMVPVDLYIPGCPPHPLTILEGLLRFLGRIDG
jgi:Ni,Fe-hydrogenase III small subunit